MVAISESSRPRLDREAGDLRLLRSFVAVVREGSFSAGAAALHLSQQAVSIHIGKLERGLGVELLTRTTRSQSLTPVGMEFYSSASRILADIEELWDHTQNAAGGVSGPVTVGISSAAGLQVVPDLVADLRQVAPNVSPTMVEDRTSSLLRAVHSGELDVALVLAPGRDHGLVGWPLLSGQIAALVSPASPLAGLQAVPVDHLREHVLVIPRRDGNDGLHFVATEFAEMHRISKTMESLVDTSLPEEVYSGQAFALWPDVLNARLVPGGLLTVPIAAETPSIAIWLLHRPVRPTRAAAAVIASARRLWPVAETATVIDTAIDN